MGHPQRGWRYAVAYRVTPLDPQLRRQIGGRLATSAVHEDLIRTCWYVASVPTFRIREAAGLLGVSDDTLRRWADAGRIATTTDSGRRSVEGADLAHFAQELARSAEHPAGEPMVRGSARNRFVGLVTDVVRDTVMAKVEMQSGPHRIVSLMNREAADELGLRPGVLAVASIKATNVVVEVPERTA